MILDFSISDLNRIKVALNMASNIFYSLAADSSDPEYDLARKNGKTYHMLSCKVKYIIDDAYYHPYKKEYL